MSQRPQTTSQRVRALDAVPPDVTAKYRDGSHWLLAFGGLSEADATASIADLAQHNRDGVLARVRLADGFAVVVLLPRATWTARQVLRNLGVADLDSAAEALDRMGAVLMLPNPDRAEATKAELDRLFLQGVAP